MAIDPIKHVIVLMLENRSFDHILGGLADELGLDGVPGAGPRRFNLDNQGNRFEQLGGAARVLRYDPHHEYEHVLQQLANNNGGFVEDFSRGFPASSGPDRAEIMKYHDPDRLPAMHALARNFAVCDHWFSSVPGPTWANRFFVHSGTSIGRVAMPNGILDANLHWYDQTTLYDRLNERRQSWKIYYGDIPQSLILVHQLEPKNAKQYAKMQTFYEDVGGAEGDFPAYVFIEPTYYPPGANDDHPPHDMSEGERLIADVYNSLRENNDLWMSSLLVVLADEHGGFYDHATPPAAVPPDNHHEEFGFDRLGVRVPAILVSPFAPRAVVNRVFDHTSLLQYLVGKWSLGSLGNRTGNAQTFTDLLLPVARNDTPVKIPGPSADTGLAQPANLFGRNQPTMSSQQTALFAMTQLLESATEGGSSDLLGRTKRSVTGFDGQVDVAMERVEQFLQQQRGVKI